MRKIQYYTALYYGVLAFALIVCMTMVFSSCQYKDFDEFDGNLQVKVVMDWSNLDSASVKPSSMKVVFYPVDNGYKPFVFSVNDSAIVSLPLGSYKVFTYNDDSEINRFKGFDSASDVPTVYTEMADSRGMFRTDSLSVFECYDYPDKTYSEFVTATVKGNEAVSKADDNRIVLFPQRVTRNVQVRVNGIKNLRYIKSARLSLGGANKEYVPSEYAFSFSSVSLAADCSSDDTVSSEFNAFGFNDGRHILNVFLQGYGFRKALSFDVSEQVNGQREGKGTILIEVSTDYDAWDDVPVENGIHIGVEDWDEIDIPVNS